MNTFDPWAGLDPEVVAMAGDFMSYYDERMDEVIKGWVEAYDKGEQVPPTTFYALLVEQIRSRSLDGHTPTEIDFLNLCMQLTTAIYKLGMIRLQEREHKCQEETGSSPEAPDQTVDEPLPRRSFLRRLLGG